MEPHALTTDDMDDMADRLRRLSSGASSSARHAPSMLSVDERCDPHGRRRVPSDEAGPHTPDSPGYLGQENVFRIPNYEPGQRSTGTVVAMQPLATPRFHRKDSYNSERRPSRGSSVGYSLYPSVSKQGPPTKPLPPVPTLGRQGSRRVPSQQSLEGSDMGSGDTSRYSQSSRGSTLERVSTSGSAVPSSPAALVPPPAALGEFRARPPPPPMQPRHGASLVHLVPWKQLASDKPLKEPSVYFFDISTTSATLASKHGNNIIRIWSVGSGEVQKDLKISCYTTAQARSREYFVRSHAILSEPSSLIAVAAGFGDSLEIWDWSRKKRLQTIDKANRWAAVRSNVMEAGWCPLATYDGDSDTLHLYAATHNSKKPFKKTRSIDLAAAALPILPKFPELAFSATGPLLVTASGPRPPRLGHPPPERETLLTAWEIHDGAPATPYKVVAPWQHSELDTALPSGLATYGSVAVSIWIPASYRAVPSGRSTGGFNLAPVSVPFRHVLVWDFAGSSTKTFCIPNAVSCVSPDCRFVACCDARGAESGARGELVLIDAMTGRRLWCWPDPEAGPAGSPDDTAMERALGDLSRVTEMCFSADGGFLFIGDLDGGIAVFEVRDGAAGVNGAGDVSLRALR